MGLWDDLKKAGGTVLETGKKVGGKVVDTVTENPEVAIGVVTGNPLALVDALKDKATKGAVSDVAGCEEDKPPKKGNGKKHSKAHDAVCHATGEKKTDSTDAKAPTKVEEKPAGKPAEAKAGDPPKEESWFGRKARELEEMHKKNSDTYKPPEKDDSAGFQLMDAGDVLPKPSKLIADNKSALDPALKVDEPNLVAAVKFEANTMG